MGGGRETSLTSLSVGSSTSPTKSQSSTKTERGRPRGSTKHVMFIVIHLVLFYILINMIFLLINIYYRLVLMEVEE